MWKTAFLMVLLCGGIGCFAEDSKPDESKKPDAAATDKKPAAPYPLKTCVVSGEELGADMGKPVEVEYKGRTVQLCCKGCIKKFNAEPEKYIKILDEAEAKAKKDGDAAKK